MLRATTIAVLVLTVTLFAAGTSRAEYISVIEFTDFDVFDTAEFFIVSDPGNEGPLLAGRTGVSDSKTQQAALNPEFVASIVNPTYALTTGISFSESPLASGLMSFFLGGDAVGNLAIDLLTWENGVGSGLTNLSGRLSFENGLLVGFSRNGLQDSTGANYDRAPVVLAPTPSSLALFGIGGLALLGCRRRKAPKTELPA